MNKDLYAFWCEAWRLEHVGQRPPTLEQVNRLMEVFEIGLPEIFGMETEEVS